jgi:hypothetical protein
MAHKMDGRKKHYKCGICLIGDIFLSPKSKLYQETCSVCRAKISIDNNYDVNL